MLARFLFALLNLLAKSLTNSLAEHPARPSIKLRFRFCAQMNLMLNPVIIATMKTTHATLSAILLSLLLPLLLAAPVMADDLPDLGDSSAEALSPQDEQRIADQIMREVSVSDQVVQDPEVADYVQSMGYKLVAVGPDKRQQFQFFVVRANSINAFAMPGGVIGIHTGLIVAAGSESEVASVMGHEIAHVTQRHLARAMARQKQDSIITLAAMALALLASQGSPQLAGGAIQAVGASSIQKQLDYTREHEREADRVGLQIMEAAGYDVRAAPVFFETLQRGSRFLEGSAPSFLRTHPLTSERISDVRGRADQMPYKQVVSSPEFHYVRAKLLAAVGSVKQAEDLFRSNIEEKRYSDEASQHYGLAQVLLRKSDTSGASTQLAWLRKNAAPHPMIETLAADIEMARRNVEGAARQYQAALTRYPDNRALIYGYANYLLSTRQSDKLIKFVQEKQPQFPNDPYLYEVLSKAYTAKGKNMLRHQAQGEAYYLRFNLEAAIEQMQLAAKAADGDFYQQSIVEARLRQLRQKLSEPKKRGFFN